jgi:hypothetical protein
MGARYMTVAILVFAAVLFCTVQALYWPLLPKPGTEYGWWQLKPAARAGFVLGAPVFTLVMCSPIIGAWQEVFGVSLALLWALICSFLLTVGTRWVSRLLNR